ncbi:S9 family peptidase [Morganella morganii]|uniref:S9 family peptidase n=1 Tax=Morganella morganii TaxID=582 RepID=UPI000F4A6A1B|nr:S9 family peptidase [Morganella morganii]ROJ32293.1 oligopeptidase B [Morganella morganii]
MTIPQAPERPVQFTAHGETRTDNYYWLRDDTRSDPQVIQYLTDENRYTQQKLQAAEPLREALYEEMVARMPQADESAPYSYNGYVYRTRFEADKEYPLYERRKINSGQWEVLADGNERAQGLAYYELVSLAVSADNRRIAIAEDKVGRREYQVAYRDLTDDHWQESVLTEVADDLVWSADGSVLFYVRQDPQTLLPFEVYRHRFGTDSAQDELVYREDDDRFYTGLSLSSSREWIFIGCHSPVTSEVQLINANDPLQPPVCFSPRQDGREYHVDHLDGQFYIRSDHENELFGLYQTNAPENPWQTLIAPQPDTDLEDFTLFRDWLVLQERHAALPQIRIIHRQSGKETQVAFDDGAYCAWLGLNPEPDSQLLRYGYTSMATPASVYELDMASGERTLLKQAQVNGFQRDNYHSERIWITARDGVQVPVSLVWHKDHYQPGHDSRGHNPLLIEGYGAYGASMDPDFDANRLSLLDRGFVYAQAHIRGGGELGKRWYNAGKMQHKINSFNDFVDVTRELIARRYGAENRIYATGGSAGGLLMGAVINQAPELYRGIVTQVPFVDALTTMSDPSIPLTTGEYDEWGNPENESAYRDIRAYSPYDNIEAKAYPNMLVTSGLHDSQVQYWEPAKWVAKLRKLKTDDNLLLLYTDMEAGHGGKSGRFNYLWDVALGYVFLLMVDEQQAS